MPTLTTITLAGYFTRRFRSLSLMWWIKRRLEGRLIKRSTISCRPVLSRLCTGKVAWMRGPSPSSNTTTNNTYPSTQATRTATCTRPPLSTPLTGIKTTPQTNSALCRGKRHGGMIRGAGRGIRRRMVTFRGIRVCRSLIWVSRWTLSMWRWHSQQRQVGWYLSQLLI